MTNDDFLKPINDRFIDLEKVSMEYKLWYLKGMSDQRKLLLEKQTIIYDLDGIGHRVVLVKDIGDTTIDL